MQPNQGRRRALLARGAALVFMIILVIPFQGYGQTVSLAWDASTSSNLAGYRIFRSEQSGVFGSALNGSLLTTPSFTDGTVQYGHTYYYVAASVDASGNQSGYSNQVQATLNAPTATFVTNKAPSVTAGPAQTITLSDVATVTATATDDGLPNGTLTYQWSLVSGNGTATFSAPKSAMTTASFSAAGSYTIRVTVSDGQLSASADVGITVLDSSLTIYVSKNGNAVKGALTSINESTTDPRAQKVDLLIDDQFATSAYGTSLSYKWDIRKVSGTHTVKGNAYDANNHIVESNAVTVVVK